ncbi:oligogalacturonate-specific porin KdgM family protein [Photobacterium profundum]|uniref:oligogalacturonate-specific porin KdgM family protein n=1 Tax=Photobacterium profundum TaxID=74109 RepID=UPI0003256EEA|nr:oligogalacturonate-specific porin KdgM family protein [Photobacterium profundum]
MKIKLLASSLLLALMSTAASATSINLRHEYMPDREGDQHRDRITVSHRFDNGIGFSVEAKWRHQDDEFLRGVKSGGHEVGVSYNYKVTDRFTLQPSYAADASSTGTTHKYNIRGITKITDNWSANLRLRYGDSRRTDGGTNRSYHQLNLVTDYKLSWGKVGVDLEYKDLESGAGGWKDKDSDHLVNFFGEYNQFESGWIPFMEVGILTHKSDDSAYKDEHALRYRFGVKYNF